MEEQLRAKYSDKFRVFALLWSSALVFHLLNYGYFEGGWEGPGIDYLYLVDAALSLLTPILLVRPTPRTIQLSAWLLLLGGVIAYPNVTNHEIVLALSASSFLFLVKPDDEKLVDAFFRLARPVTIVLYFFAAFHKLNTSFLDPHFSCATLLYDQILSLYRFLPSRPEIRALLPTLTIVTEFAIPALLLRPATRKAGMLVGIVFHMILGLDPLHPFANFSGLMFLMLAGFSGDRLATLIPLHSGAGRSILDRAVRIMLIGAFLGIELLYAVHHKEFVSVVQYSAWLFVSGILCWSLLVGLSRSTAPLTPISIFPRRGWQLALIVFLIVNAVEPYFGLKTSSSFDMYSNLRVRDHDSNHLLVPPLWDALGDLNDVVYVKESSEPQLAALVADGFQPTLLTLWEHAAAHPEAKIIWSRTPNGAAAEQLDQTALANPIPFWIRKFIFFRYIDQGPEARCSW
ncbi:MAG: HTTM domain-containing protein [Oligoflexia bacterium]|nr:HTTM domain-containing protein [Oligoflexia bacterium]